VRRGRLVLGIADGKVFVDEKHVYTANDMKVGLTVPGQAA
jgi:3-hydroxyacyl-[acyl-carrier protein] dehydratase/trans-2-decenoyl-[acyl-carrier protein] isomerase